MLKNQTFLLILEMSGVFYLYDLEMSGVTEENMTELQKLFLCCVFIGFLPFHTALHAGGLVV